MPNYPNPVFGSAGPAGAAVKITSGEAFPACRGLWVGTAGTATITDSQGNTLTDFPLKEGPCPLQCKLVTLGTAADVWALY